MSTKKKIGILGASGYTGADAVRLLARHPNAEISALTANTHAGKAMDEVFPHFFMLELPRLVGMGKGRLDQTRCGVLRTAARHHAGDHRGRAWPPIRRSRSSTCRRISGSAT